MMRRQSKGRRKIDIKKIDQLNNRQVTFSKRRAGLFKKASELCILCGAEVAIIVISPGKHVFSFGHSSVDAVLDHYLTGHSSSEPVHNLPPMREHNQHYSEVSKQLEEEKKRGAMIEQSKMVDDGSFWWDEPIDDMGLEELDQYIASLEELMKRVDMKIDHEQRTRASLSPSPFFAMNPVANHVGFADHLYNQTTDRSIPPGFGFGRDQF